MAAVDAKRVEQVLRNLLDNAIKYSPEGGTITVQAYPDNVQILLAVSDEGIGIPADEWDRVFERFHRVENEITRRMRGAGLGLAVCQGIVEAHGGRIWVESQPGAGSTFCFTLPLRVPEDAPMKKIRILVAEDEPRYIWAIQTNLEARDYEVLTATDGQQAIDLAADAQPDLILLDIKMPVVNGYEACRRIREFSTVPIIMITAMAEEAGQGARSGPGCGRLRDQAVQRAGTSGQSARGPAADRVRGRRALRLDLRGGRSAG